MLATVRLQGRDPVEVLIPILTSPVPKVADLQFPGVDIEGGEWRQGPSPRDLRPVARPP